MERDIRDSDLYRESEALYRSLWHPGASLISDAVDLEVAPDGGRATFAGIVADATGKRQSRICVIDFVSRELGVLTGGPHTDRLPKFSPDGRQVAFLSDRHTQGDFQLHFIDLHDQVVRLAPRVDGWVEYLQWSPDGQRILLGVAGHGADVSGGQGAVTTNRPTDDTAAWIPTVEGADSSHQWRRVWIYECRSNEIYRSTVADINVWEAVWCESRQVAAVISDGPEEGLWYRARVCIIDLDTGTLRELFNPDYQVGWPSSSPLGKHVAFVQGVCSDRWVVAGDLFVVDMATTTVRRIDTAGIDITHTEWRSDQDLLVAGQRRFETVVGIYTTTDATFTEIWCSRDITTSGFCPKVSGIGEAGDFALISESFTRSPEVAVVRAGHYRTIRSFDVGYAKHAEIVESVQCLEWTAPDGLRVEGWLLLPRAASDGPLPLVMHIHGGPVGQSRPRWLGRAGAAILMLLNRGYAVFMPNPRGSFGGGQAYARRVLGDMGGTDTYDLLSGIDHLVARRIADPQRLGVTGISYGGYMTAWLITQDKRFAAAVSVAPATNHVTSHLLSNIPYFVELFLADTYGNRGGKYFTRSPIMHAKNVRTPTLNICGARDRCTPPEEAVQVHNALVENGVPSVLVTYPEEGHGIRGFPASIDYAARLVSWVETHMPAHPAHA